MTEKISDADLILLRTIYTSLQGIKSTNDKLGIHKPLFNDELMKKLVNAPMDVMSDEEFVFILNDTFGSVNEFWGLIDKYMQLDRDIICIKCFMNNLNSEGKEIFKDLVIFENKLYENAKKYYLKKKHLKDDGETLYSPIFNNIMNNLLVDLSSNDIKIGGRTIGETLQFIVSEPNMDEKRMMKLGVSPPIATGVMEYKKLMSDIENKKIDIKKDHDILKKWQITLLKDDDPRLNLDGMFLG